MYLGRYQAGQTVPLVLQAHDGSNAPGLPNDCPLAKVWDATGTVTFAGKMPILDKYQQQGLFYYPLFLDQRFPNLGNYSVVFYWQTGSYQGIDQAEFELVDGGDPDGAVMSMYFFHCPHADFIVEQLEKGKLIQRRNPSF